MSTRREFDVVIVAEQHPAHSRVRSAQQQNPAANEVGRSGKYAQVAATTTA
jgi:hypothetical protein